MTILPLGGKKVNSGIRFLSQMALQHRNLLLNSFLILMDLGKFSSGWFSAGIKAVEEWRKMGVGRGDSSDQVERQRQKSTKAWTNYLLKAFASGPSATPATYQAQALASLWRETLGDPWSFCRSSCWGSSNLKSPSIPQLSLWFLQLASWSSRALHESERQGSGEEMMRKAAGKSEVQSQSWGDTHLAEPEAQLWDNPGLREPKGGVERVGLPFTKVSYRGRIVSGNVTPIWWWENRSRGEVPCLRPHGVWVAVRLSCFVPDPPYFAGIHSTHKHSGPPYQRPGMSSIPRPSEPALEGGHCCHPHFPHSDWLALWSYRRTPRASLHLALASYSKVWKICLEI